MTLVLAILLIALGLLLWLAAGMLPIAQLSESDGDVTILLKTTWIGAITLNQRTITGVRDARFVQDPNRKRAGELQVQRRQQIWEPLPVGLLPDAVMQAQLAKIIRGFAQHGGPPQLGIPLRGRMNLMLGFAVFFPLGTISIFTGALLLTRVF